MRLGHPRQPHSISLRWSCLAGVAGGILFVRGGIYAHMNRKAKPKVPLTHTPRQRLDTPSLNLAMVDVG